MRPASDFRTDVNALRAVAVLLVVAVHTVGLPAAGWVGVDVFFVISGYLIARSVLVERLTTGRFSASRFVRRRFWRLFPAALVVLVSVSIIAVASLRSPLAAGIASDAAAAALGVVNWVFVDRQADYWGTSAAASPFQHFWSLSVELQFYVVFPALLVIAWAWAARRGSGRARAWAIGISGILLIVSGAWAVFRGETDPDGAYFDTGARLWELAAGTLAGSLSVRAGGERRPVAPATRVRFAAVVAGFAAVGTAALTGPESGAVPVPDALLAVAGTVVVLTAGRGLAPIPVLRSEVVQWVGDASYSIYLWHFPAVIAVGLLLPGHRLVGAVLAVACSLVLGGASRRWVEIPAARFGQRRHGGGVLLRAVAGTTALAAALAALPAVIQREPAGDSSGPSISVPAGDWTAETVTDALARGIGADEWPEQLTPALDDVRSGPPLGFEDCDWTDIADPTSCRFGPEHGARSVTVVGSSVGVALMPAAVRAFGADSTVRGLTASGCPMIGVTVTGKSDDQRRRCDDQRAAAIAEIRASEPDVVIVTHGYDGVGQLVGAPSLREAEEHWRRAATDFAEAVRPSGARVVFVAAVPKGTDPAQCAALRWSGPGACATALTSEYRAGAEAERRAADDSPNAVFVDSSGWYCLSDGDCPAIAGDVLIRKDGQHMTKEYSMRLGGLLRDAVLGVLDGGHPPA